MAWFNIESKKVKNPVENLPEGIWTKCPTCGEILFNKDLEKNYKICLKCSHHFRLNSKERIEMFLDKDTWEETNTDLCAANPLDFPEYDIKVKKGVIKSGLKDSIVTGTGKLKGHEISLAISDFNFMGGSMGSVAGEKIVRTLECAIEKKIPAVIFTASGGARMQEGILSLMQMAKTSAAVGKMNEAGLPFIIVMTDPTTAGVHASYASLGDVIFAEPGALIGFAGARVSAQAGVDSKPDDFQKPSFQLAHGLIDGIVHRKDLRKVVAKVISFATD